MRTWGRVPVTPATAAQASGTFNFQPGAAYQGAYSWVEVSTDTNGLNDAVWLTTLSQVLQLNLGESPIYGNYGIPAQNSVDAQVPPDYYVMLTQQMFAAYFTGLLIDRQPQPPGAAPVYAVNATAHPGAILPAVVPV